MKKISLFSILSFLLLSSCGQMKTTVFEVSGLVKEQFLQCEKTMIRYSPDEEKSIWIEDSDLISSIKENRNPFKDVISVSTTGDTIYLFKKDCVFSVRGKEGKKGDFYEYQIQPSFLALGNAALEGYIYFPDAITFEENPYFPFRKKVACKTDFETFSQFYQDLDGYQVDIKNQTITAPCYPVGSDTSSYYQKVKMIYSENEILMTVIKQ